ncbi:MAG: metallophosphoesterase family protein, partial [Acidobacteriota bacterium]
QRVQSKFLGLISPFLSTGSSLQKRFTAFQQGLETLDELEQKTKQLPDAARQCVIWAVHFPPAFPRISPYLQLLEGDRLISSANSCGIKALLAGHTHDAVRYRRPDMTFDVFCAGTASQAFSPEGNHFRILEISADDAGTVLVSSEEYRFNNVRGGMITSRSGFRRV